MRNYKFNLFFSILLFMHIIAYICSMKKAILLIVATIIATNFSSAQNWNAVKNDKINFLTGEGRGETIDEADQQALAALQRR